MTSSENNTTQATQETSMTFTFRGVTFTTSSTNPTNREKVDAILARFPEAATYAWAWVEGRA